MKYVDASVRWVKSLTDHEIAAEGEEESGKEDSVDPTVDEVIEALQRVDWSTVDGVSELTASVFTQMLINSRRSEKQ